MKRRFLEIILIIGAVFIPLVVFASSTDGAIDSTYKYAWGEDVGWVNFGAANSNILITDSAITGYAWSENYGWINLSPSTSGVKNNGYGDLSGYAWGENLGWIDFNGVSINSSGEFSGYATTTNNGGEINFSGSNFGVKTDWRPRGGRPICNNALDDDNDGAIDYPNDRGCESLTDNDETWILPSSGGGSVLGASSPQTTPEETTVVEEIIETPKKIIEEIKKLPEIIKPFLPEFLKPELPEIGPVEIPIEKLVPKETPLSMKGKWRLISYSKKGSMLTDFTLAPLPKEFRALAQKFPGLEKTFKEVGINKVSDVEKLKSVKLTLPGLTQRLGLPTAGIKSGKLGLPKGIPIAELSSQMKQQMPAEIVFAKTGGELIDFNIALSTDEKGKPEQKISTISGKPLNLAVKPENPVKSIKGYLVFKSARPRQTSFDLPLEQIFASLIFSNPIVSYFQEKEVRAEEKMVLLEFEYTDPDGDGIYTADIQAPMVEGEYEIITVMDFEDPELGRRAIRLIAVVDPEGYVYEKTGDKETRIPGAIVSIFWLNPETKQYELWPAKEYQQENPQITNATGKYSFLVPEGSYYIKVEAPSYLIYDGKPFQVKEGSGVHINIELKTKFWWLNIVDWKTILIIAVLLLLVYNFYKDRIRERLLEKK